MKQQGWQEQQEREMPLLAGIGALVTWCEELLAILSGPILTAGLALALIDLLTNGQLLARVPALLYVWAASQAIGLDAQFIGAAAKLARAIRRRAIWPVIGYAVLCLALGYVGYLASNVFATQEANGITTAEALSRLGMDSTSWIVQRSLLAVALVFLSGFLRYVAPARNVTRSAEEERARLEAEIELLPLRQRLRAQQARGLRGIAAAAIGQEGSEAIHDTSIIAEAIPAPSQAQTATLEPPAANDAPPDDRPPTGPGSPVRTGKRKGAQQNAPVIQLPRATERRRIAASGRVKGTYRGRVRTATVEAKARAAYTPGMSIGQLQKAAGISRSAAAKYRKAFLAAAEAAIPNQAAQ